MATYKPYPNTFTGASDATGTQLDADLTYISGKIVTPKDWGAAGDGVTDDSSALQSMGFTNTSWRIAQAVGYKVTSFSVIANTIGRGDRRASPINISGASSVILNGSNVTLENLYINAPSGVAGLQGQGTSTDIGLRGLDISATGSGNGILVQNINSHRWSVMGCFINSYAFGVLFNFNAGGTKGIIASGNFVTSNIGDGLTINSPNTAIEDAAFVGNVINVTGTSVGPTGFSVSLAHANGVSVMGNMSQRSIFESHHIEDGSKNIAFIGNVSKSCLAHGLNAIVDGANSAQAKCMVIMGNTYEAPSVTGAGYAGIHMGWTGSGAINGATIMGNVVRNFDVGIYAGSGVQTLADGNVIDNCTTAIQLDTNGSLTGTNYVLGACSRLLFCGFANAADVRVGKFVCDTKPTAIIVKTGTSRPGASVEGFKFPMPNTALVNGTNQVNLFPVGTRMVGRLKVVAPDQNNLLNNAWYCTDLIYDGTTLTLANTLKETNGSLGFIAAPEVTVSGGQVRIGITSVGAITATVEVEFDGVYML